MLRKIVDNSLIREMHGDYEFRFVSCVIVGFLWMFVSGLLDTFTGTPTIVWSLLWVFAAIFPMVFPSFYGILPEARAERWAEPLIIRYNRLSKAGKALFPKDTIKVLTTKNLPIDTYSKIESSVSKLLDEAEEMDSRNKTSPVNSFIEQVEAVKIGIREENKVYRELG